MDNHEFFFLKFIGLFKICGFNLKPQNKKRFLPYFFTKQGVAMLANILKTPVADTISMKIKKLNSLKYKFKIDYI